MKNGLGDNLVHSLGSVSMKFNAGIYCNSLKFHLLYVAVSFLFSTIIFVLPNSLRKSYFPCSII